MLPVQLLTAMNLKEPNLFSYLVEIYSVCSRIINEYDSCSNNWLGPLGAESCELGNVFE